MDKSLSNKKYIISQIKLYCAMSTCDLKLAKILSVILLSAMLFISSAQAATGLSSMSVLGDLLIVLYNITLVISGLFLLVNLVKAYREKKAGNVSGTYLTPLILFVLMACPGYFSAPNTKVFIYVAVTTIFLLSACFLDTNSRYALRKTLVTLLITFTLLILNPSVVTFNNYIVLDYQEESTGLEVVPVENYGFTSFSDSQNLNTFIATEDGRIYFSERINKSRLLGSKKLTGRKVEVKKTYECDKYCFFIYLPKRVQVAKPIAVWDFQDNEGFYIYGTKPSTILNIPIFDKYLDYKQVGLLGQFDLIKDGDTLVGENPANDLLWKQACAYNRPHINVSYDIQAVNKLIAANSDPNYSRVQGGATIFSCYITNPNPDKYEVIKRLVANGADVNKIIGNSRSHTAIFEIREWREEEFENSNNLIRFLMKSGAKLDVQNNHGNTFVHSTVLNSTQRSIGILEILLNYGGANVLDAVERTPLKRAQQELNSLEERRSKPDSNKESIDKDIAIIRQKIEMLERYEDSSTL